MFTRTMLLVVGGIALLGLGGRTAAADDWGVHFSYGGGYRYYEPAPAVYVDDYTPDVIAYRDCAPDVVVYDRPRTVYVRPPHYYPPVRTYRYSYRSSYIAPRYYAPPYYRHHGRGYGGSLYYNGDHGRGFGGGFRHRR